MSYSAGGRTPSKRGQQQRQIQPYNKIVYGTSTEQIIIDKQNPTAQYVSEESQSYNMQQNLQEQIMQQNTGYDNQNPLQQVSDMGGYPQEPLKQTYKVNLRVETTFALSDFTETIKNVKIENIKNCLNAKPFDSKKTALQKTNCHIEKVKLRSGYNDCPYSVSVTLRPKLDKNCQIKTKDGRVDIGSTTSNYGDNNQILLCLNPGENTRLGKGQVLFKHYQLDVNTMTDIKFQSTSERLETAIVLTRGKEYGILVGSTLAGILTDSMNASNPSNPEQLRRDAMYREKSETAEKFGYDHFLAKIEDVQEVLQAWDNTTPNVETVDLNDIDICFKPRVPLEHSLSESSQINDTCTVIVELLIKYSSY
jgi:hypothetical protein